MNLLAFKKANFSEQEEYPGRLMYRKSIWSHHYDSDE